MELKNIFKLNKKFRKGGFHTDPNIGWGVVLAVGLLLILAGIVFGAYMLLKISKDTEITQSVNSGIKIVKKERIEKMVESFYKREIKSSDILREPAIIVDPSI